MNTSNKSKNQLEILVVEDELINEVFDEIRSGEFSGTKYNLYLAKSVKDGLDLIEKRDFDSYICDMGLYYSNSKKSDGARWNGFDEKLHELKKKYFKEEFGFDRREMPKDFMHIMFSEGHREEYKDSYKMLMEKFKDIFIGEYYQYSGLMGDENWKQDDYLPDSEEKTNGILITNKLKEKGKILGKDYIVFTHSGHYKLGVGAAHLGRIISKDDFDLIERDMKNYDYSHSTDLAGKGTERLIIGNKENPLVWKKAIEFAIERHQTG